MNSVEKAEAKMKVAERALKEWLTAWCNANDGEPETEWQKGYEAARDMVKIQLKAEKVKASVTWRQALGDDPA